MGTKEDAIKAFAVEEHDDGSVTAYEGDELPGKKKPAAEEPEDREGAGERGTAVVEEDETPQGRQVDPDDDEDDHADALAQAETDEEREEIRKRRREERKRKKAAAQQRENQQRLENQALRDTVRQLQETIASVSNRQVGADLANIEAGISEAAGYERHFEAEAAAATSRGDGAAAITATRSMIAAQNRQAELKAYKQNLVNAAQTQRNAAPDAAPRGPRPEVLEQAVAWKNRHAWYNPNPRSGSQEDQDSRIVRALDVSLESEGYDPGTPAYWAELDNRIQRVLPHRAVKPAGRRNGGNIPADGQQRPARSVVTGGGREAANSGSRKAFKISPERVQALKDAGDWDDPTRRAEGIRYYMEYDAQQKAQATRQ